jgi:hypothetical protein
MGALVMTGIAIVARATGVSTSPATARSAKIKCKVEPGRDLSRNRVAFIQAGHWISSTIQSVTGSVGSLNAPVNSLPPIVRFTGRELSAA